MATCAMTRRGRAGAPTTAHHVMPAEWAPHRATWIAWPHNGRDWPGKLAAVHWVYVEMVRRLVTSERVAIIFRSQRDERRAMSRLTRAGVDPTALECYRFPTNRSWLRDSGGTFVNTESPGDTSSPTLIDWHFNAWAAYDDWVDDDHVPGRIADARQLLRIVPVAPELDRPVVFEGGSVDVNGEGVALATEQCLLHPDIQARNPGLGRSGIERVLHDYLGVTSVVWLGEGIAGDDTHGHVDDIARFVGPRTVAAAVETDRRDVNHGPLADNLARLRATRINGRRLTVVPVPMPRPLWYGRQRLPASYLNLYVANTLVLVPTFNDPADRVALEILAELFPTREVVGVHAVDLVLGLGTIHCATLQEPAAGGRARRV